MIILKDSFLKFVIQHRHFFRKLGCMQSLAAFQCAFPVGKEGFDYKETNNFRVSLKCYYDQIFDYHFFLPDWQFST